MFKAFMTSSQKHLIISHALLRIHYRFMQIWQKKTSKAKVTSDNQRKLVEGFWIIIVSLMVVAASCYKTKLGNLDNMKSKTNRVCTLFYEYHYESCVIRISDSMFLKKKAGKSY